MPKRKRDGDPSDSEDAIRPSAQQQRVYHKLQHGVVKVGHAFKIAKGLERQKLGRRRKNDLAKHNGKDVQRIDAEINALKALEGIKCAQSHLYKSLLKIKAVAVSESLPAEVSIPVTVAMDAAALNVHARLCNSNPVKEALSVVLVDILKALGVQLSKEDTVKKRRIRAKDFQEETKLGTGLSVSADSKSLLQKASRKSSEHENSADTGSDEEIGDDSGSDGELRAFGGRLASSDEDDFGEFSDVEELERQLESEGIRKASKATSGKKGRAKDLLLAASTSPSASPSPEPQRTAPAPRKSAFLPSLTLGGYISGSDVDDDDIDVAPKKNRRGQRARQQIWEKKFGAKAMHVQKGSEQRSKGWDPKRGATDSERPRARGRPADRHATNATKRGIGGKASDHELSKAKVGDKVKHRDDDGPIHPSWAAAKLAKERKDAPVAFQGKKITFD